MLGTETAPSTNPTSPRSATPEFGTGPMLFLIGFPELLWEWSVLTTRLVKKSDKPLETENQCELNQGKAELGIALNLRWREGFNRLSDCENTG